MKDQLLEDIDMLQDKIIGVASLPDKQHLLLINEYAVDLNKSKSDIFHSVTVKMLLFNKFLRPYL